MSRASPTPTEFLVLCQKSNLGLSIAGFAQSHRPQPQRGGPKSAWPNGPDQLAALPASSSPDWAPQGRPLRG